MYMKKQLERHPVAYLVALYVFLTAVYLATVPMARVDGQLTGSDGSFYYAYLPTLLLDHDLDFRDEYAGLLPEGALKDQPVSPSGHYSNKYAIGCAILWAPFFLAGHVLALSLRALGRDIALDGIGYIYQVPTMLGSLTYGFAGVLLVYGSCRRFFGRPASAAAAALACLGTNVVYYMVIEPSMSHACSFFAVSLLLYLWLKYRPEPPLAGWICLGAAAGLIALVRLPDAMWAALPALDALFALRTRAVAAIRGYVKGLAAFGLTAAMVFSPQIAVWQALREVHAKGIYPNAGGNFHWFAPDLLNILFSLKHGFFLWHPLMLFAAGGLFLLYRRNRIVASLSGLIFVCQLYVLGSWWGWTGGDAFGGRLLISSIPALTLGLAALIDRADSRGAWRMVCLAAACILAWNALFAAQYSLGYIPKNGAITWDQMTAGKVSMVKNLLTRTNAHRKL